ncbi:MAG: replicative DNA helicase [Bacteroidota bacterium]
MAEFPDLNPPLPDDEPPRPLRIDDAGHDFGLAQLTGGNRGQQRRPAKVVPIREQAGRMPPQAQDVERSVLGALLLEREAIPKAIEILPADSFYDGRHTKIYAAIQALFERANPVDLVTLSEELKRRGDYETIGGYYLTELTTSVASAANVEYHARIIAEKSLLRKLITTMTGVVGEAYDPTTDAFDLLDRAEREIFQISESQLRKGAISMMSAVKDTLSHLESIHGQTQGVTGVPSGFTNLDALTGGWQNSDMVVIAARPSMGKTALSLAATRNAALHPEKPTGVAYFSLEMSAQQLAQRLLTSEARVDAQAARTGRLHDDDWPKLARAAGRLSAAQIFIDDTPGLGILELRAKCRRLKAEHNIGLVIVDYLQLMHGTVQSKGANREQEIAQISRSLKGLAKELDVPVLALSQLSRAVESRPDKRPQLSDLRESGSIEQDADVVMFIYRAERYGITVDDQGNSTEGLGELIIGKQRNGPVGTAKVAFVNQFARFENLTSYVASDPYGGYGGADPYGDSPYGGAGDGTGLPPSGGPPPLPPPATDAPF